MPPIPLPEAGPSLAMIVVGIGCIVLWLLAAVAWAVMSLPGALMANASGAFSPNRHMAMLWSLFLGQLLVAAAGVPAGLAVFMTESRAALLGWCAWTVGIGIVTQVVSVVVFFGFGGK